MSNIWKRALSMFLAVVMVLGNVPVQVFATETEPHVHEETVAVETTAAATEAVTEAPTTAAPETTAAQTEAPTTEAPETEAPTTEAPVTEPEETEAPTTEAATEAPETEPVPETTVAPTVPETTEAETEPKETLSGEERKICYVNLETWDEVWVSYAFDEKDFADVDHPGVEMEYDEEWNVWTVEIPVEADEVCFNDGIDHSEDETLPQGETAPEQVTEIEAQLDADTYYDFYVGEDEWMNFAAWVEAQQLDEEPTETTEAETEAPTTEAPETEAPTTAPVVEEEEEEVVVEGGEVTNEAEGASSISTDPAWRDGAYVIEVHNNASSVTNKQLYALLNAKWPTKTYSVTLPGWLGGGTLGVGGFKYNSSEIKAADATGNASLAVDTEYTIQYCTNAKIQSFKDASTWATAPNTITVEVYDVLTIITKKDGVVVSTDYQKIFRGDSYNVTVAAETGYNVTVSGAVSGTAAGTYTVSGLSADATVNIEYTDATVKNAVNLTIVGEDYGSVTLTAGGETVTPGTKLNKGTTVNIAATPTATGVTNIVNYVESVTATGATLTDNSVVVGDAEITITVIFKQASMNPVANPVLELNGYGTDLRWTNLKTNVLTAVLGENYGNADDYTVYVWGDFVGDAAYRDATSKPLTSEYQGRLGVPAYGQTGTLKVKIVKKASGNVPELTLTDFNVTTKESREKPVISFTKNNFVLEYEIDPGADTIKADVQETAGVSVTVVNAVAAGTISYTFPAEGATTADITMTLDVAESANNLKADQKTVTFKIKNPDYAPVVTKTENNGTLKIYTGSYKTGEVTDLSTIAGNAYADGATVKSRTYYMTFTPDTGYSFGSLKVNGADAELATEGVYKFTVENGATTPNTYAIVATATVNKYDVTWNAGEGGWTVDETAVHTKTDEDVAYSTAITLPAEPEREGYTFDGWEGYTDGMTMPNNAVTFTAKWKVNSYTITWNAGEGAVFTMGTETTEDDVAKIEQTYDYGAAVTAPVPVREGYKYTWDSEPVKNMPAADKEYTAVWVDNAFIMTWNANGGKLENGDETKTETLEADAAIVKPTDPTREGYTFTGWTPEVPEKVTDSDLTFTANWEANTYTITWNLDGGSFDSDNGKALPTSAKTDETVNIVGAMGKAGHKFLYFQDQDGNQYSVYSGNQYSFQMPAKNVTLTATWQINQYTVTFHQRVDEGESYVAPITQNYNTTVAKPDNPTKDGWVFDKWVDAGNNEVTFPHTLTEDITLYATWLVDTNNNGVADVLETITVSITGAGSVSINGTTVENGGSYVYNSNNNTNKIVVTPTDWSSAYNYVASATVGSTDLTTTGFSGGTLTREGVVLSNGDTLSVEFAKRELKVQDVAFKVNGYNTNTKRASYTENITAANVAAGSKQGGVEITDFSAFTVKVWANWGLTQSFSDISSLWDSHLDMTGSKSLQITWAGDARYPKVVSENQANAVMQGESRGKNITAAYNGETIVANKFEDISITMDNITMTGDNGELGQCSVAFTSGEFPTTSTQGVVNLVYTVTMKENANYLATTKTVNVPVQLATYTVKFMDENGEEMGSDTLDYGTAITAPTDTAKEPSADGKYQYEFKGWTTDGTKTIWYADQNETAPAGLTDLGTVTGNVTYYATYQATVRSYDIKWSYQLGDETIQPVSNLAYGTAITAPNVTPSMKDTAEYHYEFIGWTTDSTKTLVDVNDAPYDFLVEDFGTVTGTATYYAVFTYAKNAYRITFMDQDANGNKVTLGDEVVVYGEIPVFDANNETEEIENPTKAATAQYTYTFQGWSTTGVQILEDGADLTGVLTTLPAVDGEAIYYAVYTRKVNSYTVTYIDRGNVTTETLTYGTQIAPASLPGYEDASGKYEFFGWDGPDADDAADDTFPTVTGDVTYTAVYGEAKRTVTFQITKGDETEIRTSDVEKGSKIGQPTVDGYRVVRCYTKDGGTETVFDFANTAITEDITIYVETIKQYTLSYNPVGGNAVPAQTVDVGTTVELPTTLDGKDDHVFAYWTYNDAKVMEVTVTGDITVVAVWHELLDVTFNTDGGSAVTGLWNQEWGTVIETQPASAKTNYVLLGWSDGTNMVTFPYTITDDVTLTAVWGDDRDNDGHEDGTEKDPWLTYIWMDGEEEVNKLTEKLDSDNITSSAYTIDDPLTNGKLFDGWAESTSGTTTTYTAKWIADTNDNDVFDELEQVKVTIVDNTAAYTGSKVEAILDDVAVVSGQKMTYDSDNGGKLIVKATLPGNTPNAVYSVAIDVNDVSVANNGTYTVNNGDDITVTVNFSAQTLNAKVSSKSNPLEVKFNPYTISIANVTAQMNGKGTVDGTKSLEEMIFDAVVDKTNTQLDGLSFDDFTYEYYPEVKFIYAPRDWSALNGDGTNLYYFSERYKDQGVEQVRLKLNSDTSMYITAYIVLVEGRIAPTIRLTQTEFKADKPADLQALAQAAAKASIAGKDVAATIECTGVGERNADGTYPVSLKVTNSGANWIESTEETVINVTLVVNKYKVTWKNGNNIIVFEEDVAYGEIPVFKGDKQNLVKADSENGQWTYTWNGGWDGSDEDALADAKIAPVNGVTTYTATFDSELIKYTITWMNGTTKLGEDQVAYGTTPAYDVNQYGVPEGPENTSWDGWNEDLVPVTKESNKVFTAKFSNDTVYTVTFDSKGGSSVPAQSINYTDGETVEEPAEPTREGYDFLGWYLGEEPYVFGSTVTDHITLTAKWIKWVTVSFDLNGGTDTGVYDNQTFYEGNAAVKPADPDKDYGVFDNWYAKDAKTGAVSETAYDFSAKVTEDVTLVAKWLVDENNNNVVDTNETVTLITGEHGTASFTTVASASVTVERVYDSVNGETIQIIATPEAQYYAMPIDGTSNVSYNGNVMTCDLVIAPNAGKGNFTVNINFAQDDIGLRELGEGEKYTVAINGFSGDTKANNLKYNILKAVLKDTVPESEYGNYAVSFFTSIKIGSWEFAEQYWNVEGEKIVIDISPSVIANLLSVPGQDMKFKIVKTNLGTGHPDREEEILIDVTELRPKVEIKLGDLPEVNTDEDIVNAIKNNLTATYDGKTIDPSLVTVNVTTTGFDHSAAKDGTPQNVKYTVKIDDTAEYKATGWLADSMTAKVTGKVHASEIKITQPENGEITISDVTLDAEGKGTVDNRTAVKHTITVTADDLDGTDGTVQYVESVQVKKNGEVVGTYAASTITWGKDENAYAAYVEMEIVNGDSSSNTYEVSAVIAERKIELYELAEGKQYSVYYNPMTEGWTTNKQLGMVYDEVVKAGPGYTDATVSQVVVPKDNTMQAGNVEFTFVWAGNEQIPTVKRVVEVFLNDDRKAAVIEGTTNAIEIDAAVNGDDQDDVLAALQAQTENNGAAIKFNPNDARAIATYEFISGELPASGEQTTVQVKVTVGDGISWLANEATVDVVLKGKEYPAKVTVKENVDQGLVKINDAEVAMGTVLTDYMNQKLTVFIDPTCNYVSYDPATKTAVGDNGYFVESVTVNGETVEVKYDMTNATFELEVGYNEDYEIQVNYAEGKFTMDPENPNLEVKFYTGLALPTYEELYTQIITDPAFGEGVKEVKYLARPAGTYSFTIPVLLDIPVPDAIKNLIPNLGDSLKIGGTTETVDLEDAWLDVGAEFTTMTDEELQAEFDKEILALKDRIAALDIDMSKLLDISYVRNLLAEVNEIRADLEGLVDKIKNEADYLGYHQFGAEFTETTNATEKLKVVYADDVKFITEIFDITLIDDRSPANITGGDISVTYGEYTDEDILSSISVLDENGVATQLQPGDVTLLTSQEGKNVGTYTYRVSFRGNREIKPAIAEFTLTINKAKCTIDYDSQTVTYGDPYSFVLDNPKNVDAIEFMIGIDLAHVLEGGEFQGITPYVSVVIPTIKIPISDVLSIDFNIPTGDYTLSQIKDLVGGLNIAGLEELLTTIEEAQSSLGIADMQIHVTNELHPEDIGLYLAGAVTVDQNYETAFTIDYLMVVPRATRAYLEWVYNDSNGLFTPELLQYENILGAYGTVDGQEVREVTDGLKYLLLSVNPALDTDQKFSIDLIHVTADELKNINANGAYVQMAYYLELDNDMYYAVPIVRAFAVIPNTVDVQIVDNEGTEFKRAFDNEEQSVDVELSYNGTAITPDEKYLTVRYVGLQTNVQPYNSETPPVHAGAYLVAATYIEAEGVDLDNLLSLEGLQNLQSPETLKSLQNLLSSKAVGVDVELLTIEPSKSTITVDNEVVAYTGTPYDTTTMIHPESVNAPELKPDTTVITAQLTTDMNFEEKGLEAIEGAVNVDFPKWLDEILKKEYPNAFANGVTAQDFARKLNEYTEKLVELGIPEEMITELVNVINNLPADVPLTFKEQSEVAPTEVGAYLIVGVVTDSDHYPSADYGMLVITPATTEAVLKYTDGDANNIYTMDSLQVYDLTADAFVDGAYSEDATALVNNIFIGININGETVTTTDYKSLLPGEYVEFSYILDLDKQMYYAEPITRLVTISPNLYDVQIHDDAHVQNHDRTFVYDGTAKEIGNIVIYNQNGNVVTVNEAEGDSLTVTYIGIDGAVETYKSTTPPTNAGAYAVLVTFVDCDANGNKIGIGVTAGAMVIDKAERPIVVQDTTVTYNGKEQFPVITPDTDYAALVMDTQEMVYNLILEDDLNGILDKIEDILGREIPAEISLDELMDTILEAMEKIQAIEIPEEVQTIIDKLPESIKNPINSLLGTVENEIMPILQKLYDLLQRANTAMPTIGTVKINGAKPVEVGTYQVFALSVSRNYKASVSEAGVLTILPVQVYVTVDNAEKFFGEEDPALTGYTVEFKDHEGNITTTETDVTVTLTRMPGEDIGEYVISANVKLADDTNFALNPATLGTFTIKPVEAEITAPTGKTGLIYSGEAQSLIETAGSVVGGTMVYSLDGQNWYEEAAIANAITGLDAGTYTVYYKVTADSNHTIDGTVGGTTTGSIQVEIGKAEAEFEAPVANTLTYNGANQILIDPASTNDGIVVYSLTGEDGTWSTNANLMTGKDAGTYTVYYMVQGNKNHNDSKVSSVEATIAPAKVTIAMTAGATKVYGDNDPVYSELTKLLTVTVEEPGAVPTAELSARITGREEGEDVNDEGYAYTIEYNESENYEVVSVTSNVLKITPASVKITIGTLTISCGDSLPDFTTVTAVEGLKRSETAADLNLKFNEPDVVVGTYEVTAEINNKNYTVAELVNGSLVVEHGNYTGVVKEPTCTGRGFTTYTCACGGYSYTADPVAALGHDWGTITYTWSEDLKSCTAERVCKRDAAHVETAKSNKVTSEIVVPGDCQTEEVTKYTATFSNSNKWGTATTEVTGEKNPDKHTEGDPVIKNEVDATCTTEGGYDTVVYCSACGKELSRKTTVIAANGHDYKAVVTEPTCTAQGYTTYTCSVCDDTYKADYVDAAGHSFGEWTETKAPTCTEAGEERRDCSKCDHFETRAVEATGHDYKAVVTEPTCTEQGYTTYTCGNCGDSYVADYVDATGHSFGEWIEAKAPTCTEAGEERRDCSKCDHFETRAVEATGHDYKAVVTEPTCTEQGYTTYTCGNCGDSYVADYVEATGHAMGEWTETKAPTCTENGEEKRECSDCDYFETREIPATGHKDEDPADYICDICGEDLCKDTDHEKETIPGYAATCDQDGLTDGVKCAKCGEILTAQEVITATGHAMGEWTETKAPTCTEAGEEKRECSKCDHFETRAVEATGHDYKAVVTEPTCTEQGYTTYTCSVCGDSYVADYVDATGHAMGEWTETKAPTCTEAGEERRDCSKCDHFETRAVEATGHDYKAVVTEPTCTEQGYTTYTCSVCGDTYKADFVDATGHSFGEWTETKAPTCTEAGEEKRECSKCDHFETRAVEATGHDYKAVVTEPTCTEQGYTTYTCSVCGDTYKADYVDATGHSFGEWTETKVPTCTEAGEERRDCSKCDHFEIRAVEATGHDYKAVVTEPTCTEQGYTTYTCSVCGDKYVADYVDALGHTAGETVIENKVDADCINDGSYDEVVCCTTCGAELSRDTVIVPATGHTAGEAVTENEVKATCDTAGSYDTVVYCSVCGAELSRETTVVPAKGHTEETIPGKAPTCTETGLTEGTKCSVCGETLVEQEEIPATGHTMGDWVVTKEATATEKGEERRDCSECDYFEIREIPALGEEEPAKKTITEADVKLDGQLTYNGKKQTQKVIVTVDGEVLVEGEDYTITKNTGKNAGEYTLTVTGKGDYEGTVDLKWTIKAAKVTIKMDSHKVNVGDKMPKLTYKVISGKVFGDDELKITTSCEAKNTKKTGTFTITAKDKDPNYIITVKNGKLTVVEKKNDHAGLYPIPFDPNDKSGTIKPGATVEIDGVPYTMDEDCIVWLDHTKAKLATTYKYKVGKNAHETYPTNMYVWELTITDSDGDKKYDMYEADRVKELDNFLKYEGTSIRVNFTSNGIRFFTSMPKDGRTALINGKLLKGNLAGYKLVRAGTLFKWYDGNESLTMDTGVSSDVYGGKAGKNFRVFSSTSQRDWYTGMLTGLGGDAKTLDKDVMARPYIVLERDGEQITIYGGSIQRSIYYVATQNRDYWAAGTAYDDYVENIIATVKKAKGK